jgi:hypothetical protein
MLNRTNGICGRDELAGAIEKNLRHKADQTLIKFAEKVNTNAVVVPAGMKIAPLRDVGPK